MPAPESMTRSRNSSWGPDNDTPSFDTGDDVMESVMRSAVILTTPPDGVNFRALDMRLRMT